MSDSLMLTRNSPQIATLSFNRPQSRNALDWASQSAFLDLMRELQQDAELLVLILTGAGTEAFCAGGDLRELADYPTREDGERLSAIMTEALNLLESAPFISIAAINGYALGGGSEIALACDLRVMDEAAQFGLVQLRLGLTPGWGAGGRLLNLVGYSRALALLLAAQPLNATEALSLGLCNQISPQGEALADAENWANHISRRDPAAVRAIKQMLGAGRDQSPEQARQIEQGLFPDLWAAPAHLEAVAAFLKRKENG